MFNCCLNKKLKDVYDLKQFIIDIYIYDTIFQVQEPIVCGITSFGYDHMEILG